MPAEVQQGDKLVGAQSRLPPALSSLSTQISTGPWGRREKLSNMGRWRENNASSVAAG